MELAAGANPIRAVVIGYGMAGEVFHAPLIASTPGMAVAAIVTSNPGRRRAAADAYPEATVLSSVDSVWENRDEFDLVVVATANRAHVPLGMVAVEAGVPVVVDKPIAPSSGEARRLLTAAEEHGVPLTVFQNRRWDGDFLTVRSIIDDGLLGPLTRFESRFERFRPRLKPGAWRDLPQPQEAGGLLFDLGSHLIDQAVRLFGPPVEVYAETNIRRPGAAVDDDTFVSLHFEDSPHAHLWMSAVAAIPGPRFHLNGLRGSYVKYGLDPQEGALIAGLRPGNAGWGLEPEAAWGRISTSVGEVHVDGAVETMAGRYEVVYAELAAALRDGQPLPVNPRDALLTTRIIEAARTAARERRAISFGQERAVS